LRHALPHEKESGHNRYRQKHIQNSACHIDPEIADRFCRAAGKAPDEGDGQLAAETKLCMVSPVIWVQIAHDRFGRVGLPIGIGDEADRRVEGEIGADRVEMLRVELNRLQALQGVKRKEAQKLKVSMARP
jgi:hypothetical protein